jgi:hypothetical protein
MLLCVANNHISLKHTAVFRKEGHMHVHCTVAKFIVPDWGDKVGSFRDYEFGLRAGPLRRERLEVQSNIHVSVYV